MSNLYYVNTAKDKRGPFTLKQMKMLAECGCLQRHTAISVGSSRRWRAAGTRTEIFCADGKGTKGLGAWLNSIIPQKALPATREEADRIDREIRQQKANEQFMTDTTENRYYMKGPKTSASHTSPSSARSAHNLLKALSSTLPSEPVSENDLKKMVMQGKLQENDYVYLTGKGGVSKYVQAKTIPGLFTEIYSPSSGNYRLNGDFTLEQLCEAVSKGLLFPEEFIFIGKREKGKKIRMTRAWKIRELFPHLSNKAYCIRVIDGKETLFSYKQIQEGISRGEIVQTTEIKVSLREGNTRISDDTIMDKEKVVMAWKITGLFPAMPDEPHYAVQGNRSEEVFTIAQLKKYVEDGQVLPATPVSNGLASEDYGNVSCEHARWFPAVMIRGLFPIVTNDSYYLEQIKGRRVDTLGPFSLAQLNAMQGVIHENTKISVWDTQPWLTKEIVVDGPFMGDTQRWVRAKSIPGLDNLTPDYAGMRKEPIRQIYREGDFLPDYDSPMFGPPDLSGYNVTEEDIEDIASELKKGKLISNFSKMVSALTNLRKFYELKFQKIAKF